MSVAAAAWLAACGGSQPPIGVPGAMPQTLACAKTYRVLYNFGRDENDGIDPEARLTNVDGILYGTTSHGGRYNDGTVFSITTTGTERVLHSFGGSLDGTHPEAGLIDVNGTLYGTTMDGGNSSNAGTIFAIRASGKEKVLYSFAGGPDGANPMAGLTDERTRLLDAFAIAEAPPLAVVNLERTTYIDSSVLECLIALKVAREKQGSALVLVGNRDPVRRIFELTRVDSFFDIRPSLRDLRIDEAAHARRLTIESRPLT